MPRQKTKTQVGASIELAITTHLVKEGNFGYAIQSCVWEGIQKLEQDVATLQLDPADLNKRTDTTKTTNTFSLDIGVASRIEYFATLHNIKFGTVLAASVREGFIKLYPDIIKSANERKTRRAKVLDIRPLSVLYYKGK